MSKSVVVLGGGGHGKVLIEALNRLGCPILGVLDPALSPKMRILGAEVLGNDSWLESKSAQEFDLVNGLGILPQQAQGRHKVFTLWRGKGFHFISVLHPSAIFASDVRLGEGVQVMAGAVIQPGTVIGANSIVNTRVAVDHDCRIGADCHLAPGVTLSGGVWIGDGCHIGTGANVIQGIVIGDGAVVAAGATVYRDVPAGSRYIPGKS